jgi:hypothetical protein
MLGYPCFLGNHHSLLSILGCRVSIDFRKKYT